MELNKNSRQIGYLSGLIAGIGYLLYGLLFALNPLPSNYTDSHGFYTGFIAGNGTIWVLSRLVFILGNTVALGIVLTTYRLVADEDNQERVEFATLLGLSGFILHAYSFADQLSTVITISQTYGSLTSSQQASIDALGGSLPDRFNVVRGIFVAIWLLSIAYYGSNNDSIPKILGIIMSMGGLVFIIIPIDSLLLGRSLNFVLNASAGILGPLTFFWLAFICKSSE